MAFNRDGETDLTETRSMPARFDTAPQHRRYDTVIIGGAMMGSALAFFLADNPDYDGRILVVERDGSYEASSTALTNSCMRQQFSNEVNIRISRFAAEFIRDFPARIGDDNAPAIHAHHFGYLYLAVDAEAEAALRSAHALQTRLGAGTEMLGLDALAGRFPFLNLDGIRAGSHNTRDEGYWDGGTVFHWLGRRARALGAEYIENEVTGIGQSGGRVQSVTLRSGERITCGRVVNCAGPRASIIADMAGISLPVEPRRRYTFIFDAATPLDRDLPLTVDPSGVHVRSDGGYYLAGCPPLGDDRAMDPDDFSFEDGIWEEKLWPAIAHRIPAFERVKVVNAWVGHYAYNAFDCNAVLGSPSGLDNFIFMNGFSGHGLQQAPAMGRGVMELITYGEYRSLDLSAFSYDRITGNTPFAEAAVI